MIHGANNCESGERKDRWQRWTMELLKDSGSLDIRISVNDIALSYPFPHMTDLKILLSTTTLQRL